VPSILASAIVDKAEVVLQDTTNVRWIADELLGWLNDAQREIVLAKPDAFVVTKAVQLTSGTKQTIGGANTTDAIMLLKVVRNLGPDGITPGKAIRTVPSEVLDANRPGWHSEVPTAAVSNVVYDPRAPKQFYVYPQNDGTQYVELMYSATPPIVAALGNTITLDDVFANAILDYILYRAYSKDAEYAGNAERANRHYGAFISALGMNTQNLATMNANLEQVPFNPAVPAAAK
jgi:hypothetical protein